jgi:hypothetical protein
VKDPKLFWESDCLELFIDSRNDKIRRDYNATDHQFWLSPLPQEKRTYLGRWKRFEEIPKTLYDIKEGISFCTQKEGLYVMEGMIASSCIAGFNPKKGEHIGMNINITLRNSSGLTETFWPPRKREDGNIVFKPNMWGVVLLE